MNEELDKALKWADNVYFVDKNITEYTRTLPAEIRRQQSEIEGLRKELAERNEPGTFAYAKLTSDWCKAEMRVKVLEADLAQEKAAREKAEEKNNALFRWSRQGDSLVGVTNTGLKMLEDRADRAEAERDALRKSYQTAESEAQALDKRADRLADENCEIREQLSFTVTERDSWRERAIASENSDPCEGHINALKASESQVDALRKDLDGVARSLHAIGALVRTANNAPYDALNGIYKLVDEALYKLTTDREGRI